MTTILISPILDNQVTIGNTQLHITEKCRGTVHNVCKFQKGKTLAFPDGTVKSNKIVLKTLNGLVTPRKNSEELEYQAYQDLVNKRIRVPKIFLRTKNGWVLERIRHKVKPDNWKTAVSINKLSLRDKKVLQFARKILSINAENHMLHKPEHVNDFYPRNVMVSRKNKPYVVDFSPVRKSKFNLFPTLNAWANTNHVVFEYLIKKFPEVVKKNMIETWHARNQV